MDGEAPSVHRPCSAVSQENGSGDTGVETAPGDLECSTSAISVTAETTPTPPRVLKPAVVKEEVPSHRSPSVSHHTTGPRSIFSPSCQLTLDGALASPPLPPSGSEDPLVSTVMRTTPVQEDQECGSGEVQKAVGRHGSVTDLPEGGDISDTKRESAALLSVTVLSEPFSPPAVPKESELPPSRERLSEVSPDRGEPPTKMFHLSGVPTAKVTHLSHETTAQALLTSSERQVAHILGCEQTTRVVHLSHEQPAKVAHLNGEPPVKVALQSDEPPSKVTYLSYETTVKAAHPSSELPTAHRIVGDTTGCSVTAGAQPSATEPAASQLTAADSFLAALSARVQSRAERTPLSARRGLPSALLTSRAGRRVRGRPRVGPVALSRALSRCGLPEPRRGAAARTPRAAEPPGVGQGAVCGLTQTQRSSDDHVETAVPLDEVTLRCLACLVERGDELLQPLRLDVPFALLEPDNSRRLLKEMCSQVNESLSSLERQGLLRQYRHTLAVHGLAKARDMTAHLSAVCGLRQLRIFSRTHADILQGCLDAVIGDLESTLAGRSARHPRVAALLALLTELHVDSLPGPVLVVTEQLPELAEELSSALTEVPGVRHVLLTADEPQQRLNEALRQRAVLVLSCGAEVPTRWPLSRCALLVPLLPPAAAGPLVQRCRASSVAVRCLPVRPDWEALRHPERHVLVSPPPAPPPPGPPPAGQPVSVVACASAAERWGLRRLEELSGHTVTAHVRDYSRLVGLSAGPFPDLVLAADSCLLVRSLADLASPSDGQRLAAEVRALQQQAALCWLVVVGRRRAAAAADTDTRREEAVVGRLRALLASAAHLPEYTLRLVRADQDSVVHIVLDIVQQTSETAGSAGDGRSDDFQPSADAQCTEDEWLLLQLPACNAVSAGLLLRRAGGLQQLRAAPLGRLVQIMPELPVRVLAALQRHLQQPKQTTATPGDFCVDGMAPMNNQDLTGPGFLSLPRPPSPPTAAFPSDVLRREPTVPCSRHRRPGLHPDVPPFGTECHTRPPYDDESDGDYGSRHHPVYGGRFDRQHGSEHGLEHGGSAADGTDDWLTAPNAVDLLAAEACSDECNPHWLDEDNVYDDSPPMETSQ
ncbi:uncharacterized protein LOC122370382 [Amphibalanus amphitrite]|uniref:uncharacterized protein LOC122370382 n=1 Tax=Amphibalanus amphitrite TaxID=1232801 RepID=UPI001C90E8E0|nr:uncharacterized protein LOC122370382 [Amphibalanus amphitrite]